MTWATVVLTAATVQVTTVLHIHSSVTSPYSPASVTWLELKCIPECYPVLAGHWSTHTHTHTQNWATNMTCWWNASAFMKIFIQHIGWIYFTCHMQKWAGQVAALIKEPHGGHYWQTAVPGVQAVAASPRVKSPAALPGFAFATGPPLQAGVDRHPLTGSSPKSKKSHSYITITSTVYFLHACQYTNLNPTDTKTPIYWELRSDGLLHSGQW